MGKDSIIAVSIIVPVYNAEKYLHRCIDSILAQTFTDFELLLINDGSKDNSGKICDEYAAKDNRIRVFHKENGGVSSARNLGLDNAKGEWVTFVDSDDWIDERSLENLVGNENVDLILASMSFESCGTIGHFPVLGLVCGEDLNAVIAKNIDHYSICSPCCKLFRMAIIQESAVRFNENLCFGEDSLFVKKYLLKSNSINSLDTLVYHYQDIGDDIYQKYSKSFLPVMNYYQEMNRVYDEFESNKGVSISRNGIVGVVFNIARICLVKNGLKDLSTVRAFLNDSFVQEELRKRKSLNICIQRILARLPKGYMLLFYVKTIEYVKSIFGGK